MEGMNIELKKSACGQVIIHSGEDRLKVWQKGYKKLCLWTGHHVTLDICCHRCDIENVKVMTPRLSCCQCLGWSMT
jgi:hypothetical protein